MSTIESAVTRWMTAQKSEDPALKTALIAKAEEHLQMMIEAGGTSSPAFINRAVILARRDLVGASRSSGGGVPTKFHLIIIGATPPDYWRKDDFEFLEKEYRANPGNERGKRYDLNEQTLPEKTVKNLLKSGFYLDDSKQVIIVPYDLCRQVYAAGGGKKVNPNFGKAFEERKFSRRVVGIGAIIEKEGQISLKPVLINIWGDQADPNSDEYFPFEYIDHGMQWYEWVLNYSENKQKSAYYITTMGRAQDPKRIETPNEALAGLGYDELIPYFGSLMLTPLNEETITNICRANNAAKDKQDSNYESFMFRFALCNVEAMQPSESEENQGLKLHLTDEFSPGTEAFGIWAKEMYQVNFFGESSRVIVAFNPYITSKAVIGANLIGVFPDDRFVTPPKEINPPEIPAEEAKEEQTIDGTMDVNLDDLKDDE